MPAPAGAFSVFPPLPQQCLLPKEPFLYFPSTQQWLLQQERYLYFITTAVVTAPLRSATCISPLPQQWLLPQERYLYSLTAAAVLAPTGAFSSPPPPRPNRFFPHCRSSARSRRSFLCISTIAAAMSTPEGAFSVFPLDAAVTAPAGALSVFHHYRCSDCSPQERYLYFPTAPAVTAPAGAFSSLPQPPPPPPPPPYQPSSSLPQ